MGGNRDAKISPLSPEAAGGILARLLLLLLCICGGWKPCIAPAPCKACQCKTQQCTRRAPVLAQCTAELRLQAEAKQARPARSSPPPCNPSLRCSSPRIDTPIDALGEAAQLLLQQRSGLTCAASSRLQPGTELPPPSYSGPLVLKSALGRGAFWGT